MPLNYDKKVTKNCIRRKRGFYNKMSENELSYILSKDHSFMHWPHNSYQPVGSSSGFQL